MASIIAGTNGRQVCLANIFIGVIGVFIGSFLVEFLTGRGVNLDFNFRSFAVTVIGSLVLLFITGQCGENVRGIVNSRCSA